MSALASCPALKSTAKVLGQCEAGKSVDPSWLLCVSTAKQLNIHIRDSKTARSIFRIESRHISRRS